VPSPRKPGPGAAQPKSKVRKILDTTFAAGELPVEQELIVRQRQPEQRGQEDAPSVPRPFFSEARASGRASAAEVHHCCLRGSELPGSQARAAWRVAPLMEQLTCSALRTNSAILAPVSIRNQKTCFGSCNIVTEA